MTAVRGYRQYFKTTGPGASWRILRAFGRHESGSRSKILRRLINTVTYERNVQYAVHVRVVVRNTQPSFRTQGWGLVAGRAVLPLVSAMFLTYYNEGGHCCSGEAECYLWDGKPRYQPFKCCKTLATRGRVGYILGGQQTDPAAAPQD